MKLDEVHRMFRQRHKRAPSNKNKKKIYELSRLILSVDTAHDDRVTLAEEIRVLEQQLPGIQTYDGNALVRQISAGDYSIERPYQIRHQIERGDEDGYIYLFSSISRPRQCKLGATTLPIYQRAQAYKSRYGYSVEVAYSKWTSKVFRCEKNITDKISHRRVSGMVVGDSNEWYYGSIKELAPIIEAELATRSAASAYGNSHA